MVLDSGYMIFTENRPLIIVNFYFIDEYGVSIERKTVQGDMNAKAVLGCLTDIAMLYGDQFLFQQYFPFIHDTVSIVFIIVPRMFIKVF